MAPTSPQFWGPPTSTVDWCEMNYEVSPFIAEFWNTVSNLIMIILPILGIIEIMRMRLEKKYILTHCSLIAVGIGSWAFHMTLLYYMQLLDELPMLFANGILIYQIGEIRKSVKKPVNSKLAFACCVSTFLFSVIHVAFKNNVLFQGMYGAGVLVVLSLDYRLIVDNKCRTCTRLLSAGFLMFLVAFGLWNIDNQHCSQLTNLRTELPPYLGPMTQLHAWWHVLTGYGTYIHILFIIHARSHFVEPRTQVTVRYFGISVEAMYRQE
ncbi:Alkaline ceramidase 3 [Orchesella cincta]|uniref:Alkaline ceramidase n=1 Tax=Orchesella cincta TaxID=48709 RepID=A0A1D2NCP6_ORCCI|nr:Alkaline ceramidase 3 [Orchesella cincta]